MKLTREQRIRQKLYWFQEASQLGNIMLACRRMGISRKKGEPASVLDLEEIGSEVGFSDIK